MVTIGPVKLLPLHPCPSFYRRGVIHWRVHLSPRKPSFHCIVFHVGEKFFEPTRAQQFNKFVRGNSACIPKIKNQWTSLKAVANLVICIYARKDTPLLSL